MKKFLTIIMALMISLAACFGLTACGQTESGIADGKLTIGYTKYAPMNYFEGNELVGFDTELAIAFCEEIGVDYEFVEIEWSNKFIDLESSTIDVIWNGMTITDERLTEMEISVPYLANKQVAVVKKADAAKYGNTKDEFMKNTDDAVIIAEKGSAGEELVKPVE